MITKTPKCNECIHIDNRNLLDMKRSCSAFKSIIPEEIWVGANNHSKPLPEQDNNIIFTPIPNKD